ncbi:MAG: DUF1786 domain-containing protein [Candidatus Methanospirare jalkutatii]|nr:DUF1786 domain-containing protein [Candidatus Methanospirare jalkutatii]
MRILAIDIGKGTQDILVYESGKPLESAFKLVLPSPTSIFAGIVRKSSEDLVIYGDTMGGGPFAKAVIEHVKKKKRRVFMTESAARTIRDNLEVVKSFGIELISEEEVEEKARRGAKKLHISDFNPEILNFLAHFGVEPAFDVIAIAVQDHGVAPSGVSDRENRFRFLAEKVGCRLEDFAFVDDVPKSLSRMLAVLSAVRRIHKGKILVMDTGPAAALGSLEEERVKEKRRAICVNVGNAHTVAFSLEDEIVKGIFEHHTHLLERAKLKEYLRKLASGSISFEEVFADGGHGAVVNGAIEPEIISLTGPKRFKMRGLGVFAAPAGDMMMTGAVGLVRAVLKRCD